LLICIGLGKHSFGALVSYLGGGDISHTEI
jgi:hypothetical protein